jgi:hypothetical protein
LRTQARQAGRRISNEANRQERDRRDDHWFEGVGRIARFHIGGMAVAIYGG